MSKVDFRAPGTKDSTIPWKEVPADVIYYICKSGTLLVLKNGMK